MSYVGYLIDGLQYANWSEGIFHEMRSARLDAAHVTIAYHENFREMIAQVELWNQRFIDYSHHIIPGKTAADVVRAHEENKTAIFFGFQNPSPIEDDIGLVEVVHTIGVRFMQLSYNNQSLLASGCYEDRDTGITRMGKEVIAEMNRVGLVVDMSHSAEQSTLEAMELSTRPIVISHANPAFWHPAQRNKSDTVLKQLAQHGGILGLSLYPHHLKNGSDCELASFCQMACETVELMGINHVAIGSDLCQNHPDSTVEWMRNGRWTKTRDFGEGSAAQPGFPRMPDWFSNNMDFPKISAGLARSGMTTDEVARIMGNNWFDFFSRNFTQAEEGSG